MRVVRRKRRGSAERRGGILVPRLGLQKRSQVKQRIDVAGLGSEQAPEAGLRLGEIAGFVQDEPEVVERGEVGRVALQGAPVALGRRRQVARRAA